MSHTHIYKNTHTQTQSGNEASLGISTVFQWNTRELLRLSSDRTQKCSEYINIKYGVRKLLSVDAWLATRTKFLHMISSLQFLQVGFMIMAENLSERTNSFQIN
jgi:hypothetical protein